MRHVVRRGTTLVELMIAMFVLGLAVLATYWTISSSNKGAMDSYMESLAQSLVREPIEVFRGFGYEFMANYAAHPLPRYPVGETPIADLRGGGPQQWPVDALLFKRRIALTHVEESGIKAIRVRVSVSPAGANHVMTWLSRNEVVAETLIVERIQ